MRTLLKTKNEETERKEREKKGRRRKTGMSCDRGSLRGLLCSASRGDAAYMSRI